MWQTDTDDETSFGMVLWNIPKVEKEVFRLAYPEQGEAETKSPTDVWFDGTFEDGDDAAMYFTQWNSNDSTNSLGGFKRMLVRLFPCPRNAMSPFAGFVGCAFSFILA